MDFRRRSSAKLKTVFQLLSISINLSQKLPKTIRSSRCSPSLSLLHRSKWKKLCWVSSILASLYLNTIRLCYPFHLQLTSFDKTICVLPITAFNNNYPLPNYIAIQKRSNVESSFLSLLQGTPSLFICRPYSLTLLPVLSFNCLYGYFAFKWVR